MRHFKSFYPSEFLQAHDLAGREVRVTISKVDAEDVPGADGSKKRKLVLHFDKAQKRLPLCKTSARVIAGRHGVNVDDWVGKQITVYGTECQAFGATVECVRVKV